MELNHETAKPRRARKPKDEAPAPDTRTMDLIPEPAEAGTVAVLTPIQRAIQALKSDKAEKELKELVAQSVDITAVVDPAGRDQAHRMGMTLKTARTTIQKTGKAAREDAQAFAKAVIAEENRLIEIVTGEEDRIFALRDAFDEAEARKKAEAERIEAERVAAIRAKIAAIAELPAKLAGASSDALHAELTRLATMEPPGDEFAEFLPEVHATINTVGSALHVLYNGAREREAAEARRAAEQEAERQRIADQAEANARAAAALAQQQAEIAEREKVQAEAAAVLKRQQEQQEFALETIDKLKGHAAATGDAYLLEWHRHLAAQDDADVAADWYGMAAPMVAMARDLAVSQLQARINVAVAAELPDLHAEALKENARIDSIKWTTSRGTIGATGFLTLPAEPGPITVTVSNVGSTSSGIEGAPLVSRGQPIEPQYVMTDDDHAPQFDWTTEPEAPTEPQEVLAFRAAVQALQAIRTDAEIRSLLDEELGNE